jgi:SPP1 family phage portal protein
MYRQRNIPFFQTNVKELQVKDIMDIITEHKQFTNKYRRNEKYYDGQHDILNRVNPDPSKPNNKVVCDLPAYTVDVRTGYFSGEPIVFDSPNEEQHKAIREIIEYNSFQDMNTELDVMSAIYGHAFMIVYIDEDGLIRIGIDDPYNTLVIHDNTIEHKVMGALRYYEYNDSVTHENKIQITLYTKDTIYELDGPINNPVVVSQELNIFGDIPVIEFMENSNRCGVFEKAISIVDAIESIMSSTINEIEYFDNAYLHLKGVVDNLAELDSFEGDPFEDMKNNRTLITLGDGDAKFLTKNINDTYIQNTLNRLVTDYHKLTKTPALNEENFGNASGVALKYKLFNLEKDVARKESKWQKGIQKMLKLITTYHNIKSLNYDWRDIKVTFVRALPHNEAETADIISKLIGVVSHKTLLAQLDFVEDPEFELQQLEREGQNSIKELSIHNFTAAANNSNLQPNIDPIESTEENNDKEQ